MNCPHKACGSCRIVRYRENSKNLFVLVLIQDFGEDQDITQVGENSTFRNFLEDVYKMTGAL